MTTQQEQALGKRTSLPPNSLTALLCWHSWAAAVKWRQRMRTAFSAASAVHSARVATSALVLSGQSVSVCQCRERERERERPAPTYGDRFALTEEVARSPDALVAGLQLVLVHSHVSQGREVFPVEGRFPRARRPHEDHKLLHARGLKHSCCCWRSPQVSAAASSACRAYRYRRTHNLQPPSTTPYRDSSTGRSGATWVSPVA